MSNPTESLEKLLDLEGAMTVALVDAKSGMILGQVGSGVDLELAAAGNTEVVRAKMRTIESLQLNDQIEDILITLSRQYHIIRLSTQYQGIFIYYVLDKERSNLALARRKLQEIESSLII